MHFSWGEVVGRVSHADQVISKPIMNFLNSNIVIIFVIIFIVTLITICILLRKENRNSTELFKQFAVDNYLFILWAVVPVIFFAVTKSYLSWYTYTSQIAM